MGTIIQFPDGYRFPRDMRLDGGEAATVIILPTVRVERQAASFVDGTDPGPEDSSPRSRRRPRSR